MAQFINEKETAVVEAIEGVTQVSGGKLARLEEENRLGERVMNGSVTALIDAVVVAVRDGAEELTELDQAIGDGDHGMNMRRGFGAISEQRAELGELPIGAAIQKSGMTLLMKVGGASGPLYGSLLMAFGKLLPEEVDPRNVAYSMRAGVEAVKHRGKSDAGDKTMLEVLVPVLKVLEDTNTASWTPELIAEVKAAAQEGLEATRNMQARKGRASFLGERSIGHIDPGARSSQLIIDAVCSIREKIS